MWYEESTPHHTICLGGRGKFGGRLGTEDKNHDIADECIVRMRDAHCNSFGQVPYVDRMFGQTCFACLEGVYVDKLVVMTFENLKELPTLHFHGIVCLSVLI